MTAKPFDEEQVSSLSALLGLIIVARSSAQDMGHPSLASALQQAEDIARDLIKERGRLS